MITFPVDYRTLTPADIRENERHLLRTCGGFDGRPIYRHLVEYRNPEDGAFDTHVEVAPHVINNFGMGKIVTWVQQNLGEVVSIEVVESFGDIEADTYDVAEF